MIRTQISLRQQEYVEAKKAAKELGISLAEFFRRALLEKLPLKSEKPWMRFCGFVETGDSNSSGSIDEIVYGSKD